MSIENLILVLNSEWYFLTFNTRRIKWSIDCEIPNCEMLTLCFTGEKTAIFCLSQHDWKLDIALDNYFATPEVSCHI
jgi:hypothetical protein